MTNLIVGSVVEYVDEIGVSHDALITCIHGVIDFTHPIQPCVNLVYVTKNKDKTDQYGNQLQRVSSVQHQSAYSAHGRFWRVKS